MRIALRSPSSAKLASLAERLADKCLTYPEVGATFSGGALPPGYTHDRRSVQIGQDRGAFLLGRKALIDWQAHRAWGVRLTPETPPIQPGEVLIATIPLGPIKTIVPCKIVYITDEEGRFGFAYGTLSGHPERGEESFHIVLASSGEVTFEIIAFSRPASLLVRLGSPLARMIQVKATDRYLESVRRYVQHQC